MPRYIVLLETSPTTEFDPEAWFSWTEQLDREGQLESSDLLGADALLITADSAEEASAEGPTGCAVVYADDLADAGTLAALYPGLSAGEQLVVRPLSGEEEFEDEEDSGEEPDAKSDDDEGFVL